jgi:hypothetical protein
MRENMFSSGSAVAGITSLFLSGMLAIAVALLAVLLGFFAARRKEKFYTVGMFTGAVVMIFVNLQNIGIIKDGTKTQIETVYSSMRLSNQAYAMLQNDNQDQLVDVLDRSLNRASRVDTQQIDLLVPGFKTHFEAEYIEGFSMLRDGVIESNSDEKLNGAVLIDRWAIWSNANKDKLEQARQGIPSLIDFIF